MQKEGFVEKLKNKIKKAQLDLQMQRRWLSYNNRVLDMRNKKELEPLIPGEAAVGGKRKASSVPKDGK